MVKTIIYGDQEIVVSDEIADFLETDRKRQQAEERRDRRHMSKSSSETVEGYYNRSFVEDVADTVERKILYEKLHEAIASLPNENRKLIYLYFVEERTLESIANHFGISKAAVSKRLKKITITLRSLMETWGFDFFTRNCWLVFSSS